MSQSYPGLPRAIGGFIRQFVSDAIRHIFLGFLFGLPALVTAVGLSFYISDIPVYASGYVFIALISIIVGIIADSRDSSSESTDIDVDDFDQSRLWVYIAIMNFMTVSWVSAIVLVSGGVATIVQYLFDIGYVAAITAAFLPFFDKWVAEKNHQFAVGHWAVRGSLEICHLYLALRGTNGEVDEEFKQSAKKRGPII